MAIEFKLNKRKAVEAVLWLIQKGETDMYHIFKMLFEADKYHLNKYERPIAGDGEILAGRLPKKQQKYVEAWVALREDEIKASWIAMNADNTEVIKIKGLES